MDRVKLKIGALRDIRQEMLKEDAKKLKKKEEETKGTMKGEGPPPIMLRILELKGKK